MSEEIKIMPVITCFREHKIGRWVKYMLSLTDIDIMLFNDDASNCPTGATGQNGTSKTSVASVSELSALSVAPRGGSDLSVVSSGSSSGSGRVWMSLVPLIAKEALPENYSDILAINYQLIEIIERCDSQMQIMMDYAQVKRRGAKKSIGRRGK